MTVDPPNPPTPAPAPAPAPAPEPEPSPPQIDWDWAKANRWFLVGIAVAVVAAVVLVGWLLPFPHVGAEPAGETPPEIERANALIGAYLVRWGIVLVLVAFIPTLALSIVGSFKVAAPKPEVEVAGVTGVAAFGEALLKAIPGLLKVPAGIGVTLVLVGVLLLLGTTLGVDESNGSPSAAPSASESVLPTASHSSAPSSSLVLPATSLQQ